MINMSDTFKSKIYDFERYIQAYVLINGIRYETDIIKNFNYHSSIAGNSFTIGSTNASTFEITLNRLVEGLEENQEVKPFIGVVEGEYIPLGVFYLQEIKLDKNAKITKLKSSDSMIYLNDLYNSKLAYPAKIRDVVQEICDNLKIEFVTNHISINKTVDKLGKVTYREMLSYLAQIEGCFVVFDRYGKLEFRKFNRTQEKITKNNYFLKGLTVNDVEYKLNGITADLKNKEKTILASGSAVGNQINLVNPLMKQGYLDETYSYLKQFIFKPYEISWQGNPALEVGDFVQIEVANGEYIGVPILDLQLNFAGGLRAKMSADVKTSTSTSYEYKGTIQKQIEFLNARVGADGTTIYADTTEPKNPKEGDTWFKPNGAYTDLYIYEKGQWLLKVSTGNIQQLVTKITTDEVLAPKLSAGIAKIIELDASKITSGYLQADRLQAGSITERLISEETKQGLIKGLVSETKYNELIADNNNFKSGITEIITAEVSKVKVGARNLLRNSQTFDKSKWKKWSATKLEHTAISNVEGWNGYENIKLSGINSEITSKIRGYYSIDTVKFEEEKTYTISFDIINLSDFNINFSIDKVKKLPKVEVKAKENKRVALTFNKKDFSEVVIAVETELNQDPVFSIKNIKVEEGTIATTWTPAIEDLEDIDDKLKGAIEYLESNNKDLLNKFSGIALENSKIRTEISTALKQTRDEFLFQFNNYKQLLDETGKVIEERFNDFSRYIRFKNGDIELGDVNSPFKTLLTHERISFFKNDAEVAYLSNDKLYITDAYIINSLRIGSFEIVPRSNGNLSIRKAVD